MGGRRQLAVNLVSLLINLSQYAIRLLLHFQETLYTILRHLQGDIVPSATTKPVTVTYVLLNTPADMGNALNTALGIGYRGKVEAYQDGANGNKWHIELNGPGNPTPVGAGLGDVLIWDPPRLASMSQTDFTVKFTPTP